MKNFLLLFSVNFFLATNLVAQDVFIPDPVFKSFLLNHPFINTNSDAEIQVSEAQAFTYQLNVNLLAISDMTGIEAFVNIPILNCSYTNITSLDVTSNINLTYLEVSNNPLTSLTIGNKPYLTTLSASSNDLVSIDISQCPLLSELYVSENEVLASLDVSSNPLLSNLSCNSNVITTLDLTSNPLLLYLECIDNLITELDLSQCTVLESFNADYNALTELNIKNGNNTNLTSFSALNIASLTCIQVDDAAYSTANWTNVDAGATFSEMCSYCTIYFPDINFKNALLSNLSINTNSDTEIQCQEAIDFTGNLSVSGAGITDLSGIEWFQNIVGLDVEANSISMLDMTNHPLVTTLSLGNNQLTSIDLSALPNLSVFDGGNNNFSALDFSSNSLLTLIFVPSNDLTAIDVSGLTNLTYLNVQSNQLSALNVSGNSSLENLFMSSNSLTNLDLSLNTQLLELECQANNLSTLNVANGNNINMTNFNALFNNLTCIKVDDEVYSTTNWTNIDVTAQFDEVCDLSLNENQTLWEIYPNPSTNQLFVNGENLGVTYHIFSISGSLIETQTLVGPIDISDLDGGVYYITLTTSDGLLEKIKFMKD